MHFRRPATPQAGIAHDHSTLPSGSTFRTGPSLDRRQGLFGGEGSGLYRNRLAHLHERTDAHAFEQPDPGAEPLDLVEHTSSRRFEYDPGGEPEVARQPLVPVDDPVAIVQDDQLAAAGEERGHFE